MPKEWNFVKAAVAQGRKINEGQELQKGGCIFFGGGGVSEKAVLGMSGMATQTSGVAKNKTEAERSGYFHRGARPMLGQKRLKLADLMAATSSLFLPHPPLQPVASSPFIKGTKHFPPKGLHCSPPA